MNHPSSLRDVQNGNREARRFPPQTLGARNETHVRPMVFSSGGTLELPEEQTTNKQSPNAQAHLERLIQLLSLHLHIEIILNLPR